MKKSFLFLAFSTFFLLLVGRLFVSEINFSKSLTLSQTNYSAVKSTVVDISKEDKEYELATPLTTASQDLKDELEEEQELEKEKEKEDAEEKELIIEPVATKIKTTTSAITEKAVSVPETVSEKQETNTTVKTTTTATNEIKYTQNPSITVESPKNGENLKGTYRIKVLVEYNNNQVNNLELYVRSAGRSPFYISTIKLNSDNRGYFDWDTTSVPNGVYYIILKSSQGYSNTNTMVNVSNEVKVDPVPYIEQQQKEIETALQKIEQTVTSSQKELDDLSQQESEKADQETSSDNLKTAVEETVQATKNIAEVKTTIEEAKTTIEEAKKVTEEIKQTKEAAASGNLTDQEVEQKVEEAKKAVEVIKTKVEQAKEQATTVVSNVQEVKNKTSETTQTNTTKTDEIDATENIAEFKKFEPNQDIFLDSDGDGLTDREEKIFQTDLYNPDTDGDGFLDGIEVSGGFNPNGDGKLTKNSAIITAIYQNEIPEDEIMVDSDKDGITDLEEEIFGTDPNLADSDGDGKMDGEEIILGQNPLSANENDQVDYENPKTSGEIKQEIYQISFVQTIEETEKLIVDEEPIVLEPQTSEEPIQEGIEETVKEIKKKKLQIAGKALPNSFITVYIYSDPIVVIVKTDESGNWTYTLDKTLEDGRHEIYAAVTNNSGKIVVKSEPFSFFVREAQAIDEDEFLRITGEVNVVEPSYAVLKRYTVFVIVMLIMLAALVVLFFQLFGSNSQGFKNTNRKSDK